MVKCGIKFRIHSQTQVVVPLKFGNGWVILPNLLMETNLIELIALDYQQGPVSL